METKKSVARRLLDTFFVGFGIAFAVHFVVLPVTTRDLVNLILNEYLRYLKSVLDAQAQLINSLPSRDMTGGNHVRSVRSESGNSQSEETNMAWPEADTWRTAITAATECQVKIQSELRYVKREFAYSKLRAGDFESVANMLRNILVPLGGMETIIQASNRVEKMGGWSSMETSKGVVSALADPADEKESWAWLFGQLNQPVQKLLGAMIEGLDYAFFRLQFTRKPVFSTKADFEARAAESANGKGFSGYLENSIDDFCRAPEGPLRQWCQINGLDSLAGQPSDRTSFQRSRSQLYLVLDVSI